VAPAVTGGIPAYQYTWSNGASGTSLTNIPSGMYTLTVSDAAGCFDFWTYSVGQPAAALSATWASDSSAGGWTITLDPQGGTPPYDIAWSAATGGQTGSVATGLASGIYSVTVSDANDCVLVLSIPVGTVSKTESPDVFAGLLFAPNPTAGPTRLSILLEAPLAAHIRMFSGLGQLVSDVRLSEKSTRHEALLDLSGLPSGIYRVLVLLENGQYRTVAVVKTGG